MSSHKTRVQKLEQQTNEQPPESVEIYGTRPDGTRYLIETWKQLTEADQAGELANCEQWQRFIMLADESETIQAQAGKYPDPDYGRLARMAELSKQIAEGVHHGQP